jgi:hypothetical protein
VPGFGKGPFGSGGFGQWPWALKAIAGAVPDIYKDLDQSVGNNRLGELLQVVGQSMDESRRKIRDFDDLRDVFLAPTDQTFSETIQILQVDNLGDGTSRVFISNGINGDKFTSIRLGQTLQDFTQTRFNIVEINSSAVPGDFTSPIPIDPFTGMATAKNIIVSNISQAAQETVPMVSGALVFNENPIVGQYQAGHVNDGTTAPPYIFTVAFPPIAANAIQITWRESGAAKAGSLNNKGQPNGDLGLGSSVNFLTGLITVYTKDFKTADNLSITLTYTRIPIVETPNAGQYAAGHVADGVTAPPYIFTLSAPDLAEKPTTVRWTEGATPRVGVFTPTGQLTGDLGNGSTVNFSTGTIVLYTKDAGIADNLSISVSYPEDGTVNSQHILAILGSDFAVEIDRHDPIPFQRSFVNHSFQLWDIKGSADGYKYMGAIAGFFVRSFGLYRIASYWVPLLPVINVFNIVIPRNRSSLTLPSRSGHSTFTFSPPSALADGVATITLTVTVLDNTNNPIVGQPVSLSTQDLGLTFSATSGITNGSGVFTATVSSTIAETAIVLATIGAVSPLKLEQAVSFTGYYTDIDPRRAVMDEIPADFVTTDLFDFSPTFPDLIQNVTVNSVTFIRTEGTDFRNSVVVTPNAGQMNRSLAFPQAVFVDVAANSFKVENFQLLSNTQYSFEVLAPNTPVAGAGTVTWRAVPLAATIPTIISGTPAVQNFGPQYTGFTGHRVRVMTNLSGPYAGDEPLLAPVQQGNWEVTFSDGTSAWIESMAWDGTRLNIELVTAVIPVQGTSIYISYVPNIIPECDWCRASIIRVLMTPDAILADPAALADDPGTRLTNRLKPLVPVHIRFAQFVYDPGPGIATFPAFMASSSIKEDNLDPVSFAPLYDDAEEWTADALATPGTTTGGTGNGFDQMVATSTSNQVTPFILEEHVDGTSPLANSWLGTGLWHVSQTRPSGESYFLAAGLKPSGSALFAYGITDPNTPFQNRIDLGARPNAGSLSSPLIGPVSAATTVTAEFWHYFFAESGMTNYLASVDIVNSVGVVLQHFNKNQVGNLDATGLSVRAGSGYSTPAQWAYIVLNITTAVVGAGQFRVRWNFDTVTSVVVDPTYEGWFLDDIVVRVVP